MPQNDSEKVCYLQPQTTEQRVAIARDFVARFHYDIPLLVDPIENPANIAWAGWPERLYVVGSDGILRYAGHPGPFQYHPEEVAVWLAKNLPAKTP